MLITGTDQFFEVKIVAVADSGTADLTEVVDENESPEQAYLESIQQLNRLSAQEAMDQIATTRVLFLCADCYAIWIEDPVSSLSDF